MKCRARQASGEILLTSPGVMKGYWNNTVATIETLRDGWVHTGDVGKLDHEGYLYLVDRKKDMIISGGENIYSREVEEAVVTHEAVSEVAVIGVADEKWGEAVMAVVVLKPGARQVPRKSWNIRRTMIASYKKPRHVDVRGRDRQIAERQDRQGSAATALRKGLSPRDGRAARGKEEFTMLELFSLKQKVAVMTGASRGLGKPMAKGLAAAGAHVVLVARAKRR